MIYGVSRMLQSKWKSNPCAFIRASHDQMTAITTTESFTLAETLPSTSTLLCSNSQPSSRSVSDQPFRQIDILEPHIRLQVAKCRQSLAVILAHQPQPSPSVLLHILRTIQTDTNALDQLVVLPWYFRQPVQARRWSWTMECCCSVGD